MKGNKLTKRLLQELILGGEDEKTRADILETDEVSSMMYHRWKASDKPEVRHESGTHADYARLFEKISNAIGAGKDHGASNVPALSRELEELRKINLAVIRRYRIALGVAASLLLLLALTTVRTLSSENLLKKTITESIAPLGQKSQLVLPDGTKVYLNSGTVLRYDSHFGKRNRKIELTGEAFFEVARYRKHPFTIQASNLEIKVLGTKFNVTAYADDPVIETYVTEGKVNVRDIRSDQSLILEAHQKASYVKERKQLTLSEVSSGNLISWKENILYFDNENFKNIIHKLERWYDVSISLEGKDSIDDRFTLTIKDESLREVLDLISLTTPIQYKFEDHKVTIFYSEK